ncbi:MAG: BamA/TamA family outer membrane protein [Thermoanaerobaculia bacterium]
MRAPGGAAALLALTLVAPAARAGPAASGGLYGKAVVSLSFRGDGPIDAKRMANLTELGPGRLLTDGAVRISIRNLFATRRFSDLAIEATGSGDGVEVVVVFAAAPRIATLGITPGIPARGRILDAVGLGVGDPWEGDLKPGYEASIRRVLKEEGYFEPAVVASVEAGADETSVDVRFDVRPGPHAVAAPPQWDGNLAPLEAADFVAKAKQKAGQPYRNAAAREDAERFESELHKRGFSRAEVRLVDEKYGPAKAAVSPRYSVFVGPLVVLRVVGETESVVKKHADSPWKKGEPPDEDAVERLRLALKRSYEESGYAKAAVDVTFDTQPDRETITFTIAKGARWSIGRVHVPGAVSLPPKQVQSALETRPRGVLETGRYVSDEAVRDRDALAALYRRAGWRDARVAAPSLADGAGEHTLDVTFTVDEGVRTVVDRMRVEGMRLLSEKDLVPRLSVKPGVPYAESAVSDDAALLQSLYVDRGFVDAKVEATTLFSGPTPPEGQRAEVGYVITEGKPVLFGKTIVRGNRRTKPFIIEDRLANAEGAPFSLTKLLDTQQSLARLGVFDRIDVTTFETDPETMSRSVLVTVSEARPWGLTYAVGAEYNPQKKASLSDQLSVRLSLAVTYNNLFGRALEVGVEGRVSNNDPRLIFTARERSLFGGKVPLSFAVYQTKDVPSPAYDVKRSGAFLQGEYRLGPTLRTGLRVQYELVEPSSDPGLGADQRGNTESRIASVSGGVTWDKRDDPLNPRSGFLLGTDLKYAFPLFAADAHFFKVLSQAGLYRPYGKTRFAFSLRGGVIWNFAACPNVSGESCTPNLIVPVPERFFAGGTSTHRAFTRDNLGIQRETLNESGIGVGGAVLLIGNAEWRIPVTGGFEVALFVDAGNTWADPKNVNLGEIRTGTGIGLHYLTPVGPLRLEYGLKLDRKPGEDAGAFAFSVGFGF